MQVWKTDVRTPGDPALIYALAPVNQAQAENTYLARWLTRLNILDSAA